MLIKKIVQINFNILKLLEEYYLERRILYYILEHFSSLTFLSTL